MTVEILCYKLAGCKQNIGKKSCMHHGTETFTLRTADYTSSNQSSRACLCIISLFTISQKQWPGKSSQFEEYSFGAEWMIRKRCAWWQGKNVSSRNVLHCIFTPGHYGHVWDNSYCCCG